MKKLLTFSFLFLFLVMGTFAQASVGEPGDPTDHVLINGDVVFMNQPELQLGGFGEGISQLGGVDTIEIDHAGNIYVLDDVQKQIKVYSSGKSTGQVEKVIDVGVIEFTKAGGKTKPYPVRNIRAISAGKPGDPDQETRLYVIVRKKVRERKADILEKYRIFRRLSLESTEWKRLGFNNFKHKPHDMTVDINGRIIIAEKNGTIEVLNKRGNALDTTFGIGGVVQLGEIDGIPVTSLKTVETDTEGNIYVADKDNGRIIKVSPTGTVLQVFGSQGPGNHQFLEQVEGIGVDWNGNVYGRDEQNHRYIVFNKNGTFLTAFGGHGFDPEQQENADEFVIDRTNKRFIIADNHNYRVSVHLMEAAPFNISIFTHYDFPEFNVVQPAWIAGGVRGNAAGIEFNEPNEVGFDLNGNLWAGDVNNLRVQVYDRNGNFITTVGEEGTDLCQFVNPPTGKKGPEAIRADSQNKIFVADRGGKKINVYDGNNFSCEREITSELFDDITGIVIDSFDMLYVADQDTNQIHKFANDGTYIMTFQEWKDVMVDGRPQQIKVLDKVETLALDEANNRLYASSENESRIEVFQLFKTETETETILAGTYLEEHVGKIQIGVIPQDGLFADDVEGVATDTLNNWLVASDESNGRYMIYDLASPYLFDRRHNFAFLNAFGKMGSNPGEFRSADGVTISPEYGLVAIADQGNYRIQVFKISDLKSQLGL